MGVPPGYLLLGSTGWGTSWVLPTGYYLGGTPIPYYLPGTTRVPPPSRSTWEVPMVVPPSRTTWEVPRVVPLPVLPGCVPRAFPPSRTTQCVYPGPSPHPVLPELGSRRPYLTLQEAILGSRKPYLTLQEAILTTWRPYLTLQMAILSSRWPHLASVASQTASPADANVGPEPPSCLAGRR